MIKYSAVGRLFCNVMAYTSSLFFINLKTVNVETLSLWGTSVIYVFLHFFWPGSSWHRWDRCFLPSMDLNRIFFIENKPYLIIWYSRWKVWLGSDYGGAVAGPSSIPWDLSNFNRYFKLPGIDPPVGLTPFLCCFSCNHMFEDNH